MKKILQMATMIVASVWPLTMAGQTPVVAQRLPNADNEPLPVFPVPSERQLKWQETEFYAFFHFGMNTFTDKEWGYGNEPESSYAPTARPNPMQWLKAVKAAGMRGGIAVVKHHDGFCLWFTSTTQHSIVNAGNDYGRTTNIPLLFAQAARKLKMKYGFYVSPWDRNSAYYGDGTNHYVTKVFLRQCAELAAYGSDQFEMWFDGANGGDGYYGGANTTRSIDPEVYYDIPNLRDSVHKLAPNCVMWGLGGEARWIGNEAGWAGETNWSAYNPETGEKAGMYGFEDGWKWFPGESDAKGTNQGWFWHPNEKPKSAERLFQMYLETVGRNATLILNLPPDRSGRLPAADVAVLKSLGKMLKQRLGHDLAPEAHIEVSAQRTAGTHRNYNAANLTDGSTDTYWTVNDGTTAATITLAWHKVRRLHYVMLMEYIRKGQRIKRFSIETSIDGKAWVRQGGDMATTTVGYKRIIPLNGSTSASYDGGIAARYLRINILDSKACPLLHTLSVY